MKIPTAIAAIALLSLSAPLYAHDAPTDKPKTEHSGGTDSRGCHTNHKTGDYHCHTPK
ncbi:MAG: YHYH domain-containing protein [Verrucomicrobiaceae bacterium]|nr:MAG: YHYH domain-containing protein [Verrucomicrobiaceae bacterium]